MRSIALTCVLCAMPACSPGTPDPVQADAPFDAERPTDSDGRPNAEDNCPGIDNPDQRDHDGDGRGDVCDGCPHIAELAPDEDADGDGIGDACDPHPDDDRDVLVHFDGFYDDRDGLPEDWQAGTGAAALWQVRDGQLRNTTPDVVLLASWTKAKTRDQVVDTRATVLKVSDPSINPERTVGVVAGHDGLGPGPLWMCSLLDRANDTTLAILSLVDLDTTGKLGSGALSYEFRFAIEAGMTSSFRIELRGQSSPSKVVQTCTLGFESAGASTVNAEDDGTVDGYPGLRTSGVEAAFDYIVVYGRKP